MKHLPEVWKFLDHKMHCSMDVGDSASMQRHDTIESWLLVLIWMREQTLSARV